MLVPVEGPLRPRPAAPICARRVPRPRGSPAIALPRRLLSRRGPSANARHSSTRRPATGRARRPRPCGARRRRTRDRQAPWPRGPRTPRPRRRRPGRRWRRRSRPARPPSETDEGGSKCASSSGLDSSATQMTAERGEIHGSRYAAACAVSVTAASSRMPFRPSSSVSARGRRTRPRRPRVQRCRRESAGRGPHDLEARCRRRFRRRDRALAEGVPPDPARRRSCGDAPTANRRWRARSRPCRPSHWAAFRTRSGQPQRPRMPPGHARPTEGRRSRHRRRRGWRRGAGRQPSQRGS